jgi:hypothetical protein
MSPRTNGGLARGVTHGGHIRRKNYEFIGVRGTAPASTFSYGPDLCNRGLNPVVYGGHTLGTALSGSIPELPYIGS